MRRGQEHAAARRPHGVAHGQAAIESAANEDWRGPESATLDLRFYRNADYIWAFGIRTTISSLVGFIRMSLRLRSKH